LQLAEPGYYAGIRCDLRPLRHDVSVEQVIQNRPSASCPSIVENRHHTAR
jgi:hypothetical protein